MNSKSYEFCLPNDTSKIQLPFYYDGTNYQIHKLVDFATDTEVEACKEEELKISAGFYDLCVSKVTASTDNHFMKVGDNYYKVVTADGVKYPDGQLLNRILYDVTSDRNDQ